VTYSTILHADGLESSSSTLRFKVKENHFVNDIMVLKCVSTIVLADVRKIKKEAQVNIYKSGYNKKSDNLKQEMIIDEIGDGKLQTNLG
jgi:hypothetical protein